MSKKQPSIIVRELCPFVVVKWLKEILMEIPWTTVSNKATVNDQQSYRGFYALLWHMIYTFFPTYNN